MNCMNDQWTMIKVQFAVNQDFSAFRKKTGLKYTSFRVTSIMYYLLQFIYNKFFQQKSHKKCTQY